MRIQQQQQQQASELSWRQRLLPRHQEDCVDQRVFLWGSCSRLLLSCALSVGRGREEIRVLGRESGDRKYCSWYSGGDGAKEGKCNNWFVTHWHCEFFLACESLMISVFWSSSTCSHCCLSFPMCQRIQMLLFHCLPIWLSYPCS